MRYKAITKSQTQNIGVSVSFLMLVSAISRFYFPGWVLALDAIFSFSDTLLRIATYFGIGIVGLGMAGGLLILYLRLFTSLSIPGISAVILTVIILGGFQIIFLGVMGEYIGRIYESSKNRPLYVVRNTKNI